MEKNYIILAHKKPEQLQRLIVRLNDGKSFFYIHIDKKVNVEPFKRLVSCKDVKFIENREYSGWGDIGAVLATVNCMKEVLSDSRKGYCILLSGQDYPIKSNAIINAFLDDNEGSNFVNFGPVQEIWPHYECVNRLQKYKFNLSRKIGGYALVPWFFSREFYKPSNLKSFLIVLLKTRNLNVFHILRKRKMPKSIIPFGGAQWWVFTNETVSKIIKFIDNNKEYVNYHKFTLLADEIFFQSILNHLVQIDSSIILKPSITYVNWTRKNVSLPVTFSSTDLEELLNVPPYMLFARKFDLDIDRNILDQLDVI